MWLFGSAGFSLRGLDLPCTSPRRLKPALLNPDVAGVQRARHAGVARAFDDGATVGEDGHLVGWDAEAQEKTIFAHFCDGGRDAFSQRGEIELTAAFVNLHRVAAAHGQVRLRFAFEVAEIVAHAGAAIWIARPAHGL